MRGGADADVSGVGKSEIEYPPNFTLKEQSMPKDNRDFFKTKKIWSEVKDELLGCYLVPYFNKILSMGNPVLYVDCFAGKGNLMTVKADRH